MSISEKKSVQQLTYSQVHLQHPEWWETFYNKMKTAEKNILSIIISALKKDLINKQKLEIIGVGMGEGDREIPIFKTLIAGGKQISVEYLDISYKYYEVFLERFRKNKLTKILSDKHIVDWAEFQPQTTYDLALVFHAFYGMNKILKKAIQKTINLLKVGGLAYILHSGEDGMTYQFFYQMTDKKVVTGESIINYLNKIGVSFEVHKIKNEIDLGFCISKKGEPISREGQFFISYILDRDYRLFSQEEKRRTNNILKQLFKKNGKYIGSVINNLIIIRKK